MDGIAMHIQSIMTLNVIVLVIMSISFFCTIDTKMSQSRSLHDQIKLKNQKYPQTTSTGCQNKVHLFTPVLPQQKKSLTGENSTHYNRKYQLVHTTELQGVCSLFDWWRTFPVVQSYVVTLYSNYCEYCLNHTTVVPWHIINTLHVFS